jgi:cytochrome P450
MAVFFILGASILIVYTIQKYLELQRAARSVQYFPGAKELFSSGSAVVHMVKRFVLGASSHEQEIWAVKHKPFAEAGWDATVNISLLPSTSIILSLADAAAIKEVITTRARFPKPVKDYKILTFFGDNIIASEGEEWKRYRKIAAPAFGERNNNLVWDETMAVMSDLFDNVWGSQKIIVVDQALDITVPIALFVISAAGFGRKIYWREDKVPPNHKLSFKDAIYEVSLNSLTKVMVPDWAMGLNEHTRKVRLAFQELESYMLEMASHRRHSEQKEENYDLLSALLDAGADDPTFTDRDLTGNIFIFLIAGHETSAHTLCYALALLALYPSEQEILLQHIKSILPNDKLPTYDEMPRLTYSLAVINEALRMFPPVPGIPKSSAEDTSLTISNNAGEQRIVPVPRGIRVTINTAALHHNPRYWKDPEEFRPARFMDPDWPRDAFIPFSAGARACIGRRFAEIELVVALTMMVMRYKIEVKEEPQFARETFEERKARVLASKAGLTTTPLRVPLVFTQR